MKRSVVWFLGWSVAIATGAAACSSEPAIQDSETRAEALVSNVHVLTSRNDEARTGHNPREKILDVRNVTASTFGRVFTRALDGAVFAQPLYVGGVEGRNVVYVATEHNSVYAFDADDTRTTAAPLWVKNFGPSLPSADTGCSLLSPEIGITATPVVDLATKTMWFTSRNKEAGRVIHRLHAIDLATGANRPSSPVEITAQAAGTGDTSVSGVIRFDPLRQMQRPGLLKVGNRVYLGFASQCDIQPYHGWLMAYDATTLQQKAVLNTTPNGGAGGIWNGGVGLNADAAGDIYFPAADIYADPNAPGPFNGAGNLGNSLVRVRDTGAALAVQTTFTPFDTRVFGPQDLSLGPTGGILLPGTNLYVASDKRGVTFVVDRTNMGGQANQDAQIVQRFQGTTKGMWGGAAYYKKGAGGLYYLWGSGDRLKSYRFDGAKFLLPPQTSTAPAAGYPGGALSLSSDGETSGTAILWSVRSKRTSSGLASSAGDGVVQAWDATDVSRPLWSSDAAQGDAVGAVAKFAPVTVANGRVFVGTAGNQLVVYGLRGSTPIPEAGTVDASSSDAPPDRQPDAPAEAGATPTWSQLYALYFGPSTPGHCSGTGGCHTNLRGGFRCGTTKAACYQGLVDAGLVTPARAAQSPLGIPGQSPLVWFDGSMPLDNASPNPAAAAAVKAWLAAGAKND